MSKIVSLYRARTQLYIIVVALHGGFWNAKIKEFFQPAEKHGLIEIIEMGNEETKEVKIKSEAEEANGVLFPIEERAVQQSPEEGKEVKSCDGDESDEKNGVNSDLRPRLVTIHKTETGFGFNLRGQVIEGGNRHQHVSAIPDICHFFYTSVF